MDTIQFEICKKYGADYISSSNQSLLGISLNVKDTIYPIHGLRHTIEGNNSGWFI